MPWNSPKESKSPLVGPLPKLWGLWFFWWIPQHFTKNTYVYWEETHFQTNFVHLAILKNSDMTSISNFGWFLGETQFHTNFPIWLLWKTPTGLLYQISGDFWGKLNSYKFCPFGYFEKLRQDYYIKFLVIFGGNPHSQKTLGETQFHTNFVKMGFQKLWQH